ncbi:hypothetical protein XH84_14730 [Bradyrhizobium nanningense]|uniref:hypothetical protein n=1 Tax=Bradyrhizobium nanningense TaxID=1325118 RepID=UPI001008702D|nr:hypothetical protein [Bradyrhizobium nanningense]RXH32432.1 hypothetical protein XH84_14730 [Bradyrhizobium nanningense]
MDSHNFAISNAASPPSGQQAVLDDQQANQAEEDAFEQQLDSARVGDPIGLARRPGRKPRLNVSREDHDYIQLANTLLKQNKHVGMALRPLQEQRGVNSNSQGQALACFGSGPYWARASCSK